MKTCPLEELGVSKASRKSNKFCLREVGCAKEFRPIKIIGDPFKFCFGKVNIFYIKFARNKFREINHRLKKFCFGKISIVFEYGTRERSSVKSCIGEISFFYEYRISEKGRMRKSLIFGEGCLSEVR